MSAQSKIQWTEATWNPVTGCTKVSPGCQNCYAERMAKRLAGRCGYPADEPFQVTLHPERLGDPLKWRKPRKIFVCSMGDLFHAKVPCEFIFRVFNAMNCAFQHEYQILTKRVRRLMYLDGELEWADHIWMGVSVENADYIGRIDELRQTRAAVKFLSLEPLLGPLPNLNLTNIDWVIVGGESGPGARPMKEEWVTDIRDQCLTSKVPFFFKQWGGTNKKKTGRILQGRTWDEMPNTLLKGASNV